MATSANLAGGKLCFTTLAVKKQFAAQKLQPDVYLDAGALPKKKPSTIVKEEKGELVVLRRGEIKI